MTDKIDSHVNTKVDNRIFLSVGLDNDTHIESVCLMTRKEK